VEGAEVDRATLVRLVRAGALTALVDGLFSSVLSAFFYQSTVARLWQGVASVPLGREALDGGTRTELIGMAMHVSVAFWWSAVFLFVLMRLPLVRSVLKTPFGVLKVAAVYGPCIWMAMSCLVIPTFTGRPPTIGFRWWVQFFGHIPFVTTPMVWAATRWPDRSRR